MANETLGGFWRLLRGPRSGTYTLNGTTPVVVANRLVTPNTIIGRTLKTIGGTPGTSTITSITPGVGFTVTGSSGDTSTHNYVILS